MGRFLKSQVLEDKVGKHLLTVDCTKADHQLPISQMKVGEKTRSALSKLSSDQQKIPLQGMKQFYMGTTKYLIGHLPINNKLLRNVVYGLSYIHFSERVIMEHRLFVKEKVALVTDEWTVYQVGTLRTPHVELMITTGQMSLRRLCLRSL